MFVTRGDVSPVLSDLLTHWVSVGALSYWNRWVGTKDVRVYSMAYVSK